MAYRLMRLVSSPANPICTERSYKEMAINQHVSINSREKRTVIETSQLTWAVSFIWWSEWIVYVLRLGMGKYIPTKWRHCLGYSQQPMIFNLQNHPNDLWKNKRKRFNRNIATYLSCFVYLVKRMDCLCVAVGDGKIHPHQMTTLLGLLPTTHDLQPAESPKWSLEE